MLHDLSNGSWYPPFEQLGPGLLIKCTVWCQSYVRFIFEYDSLMIVSPFYQGSEDAFVQILYLVMQENISGELFCFDIYINVSLMDIYTIMI